ncbi:hypothetical protein LTR92_011165 [Exophiala xenobiotica]|nr:hypothetical protein LTR92_011165 [Exophiala xenobiotica]KAK5201558.1 hypothetical protein LTR41_012143 [Exophiala xenobiotica]
MSSQVNFSPLGVPVVRNIESIALPGGTRVLWSATHGASFWAVSTKIDTEDAEGQKQSYFMKVYTTAKGRAQVLGEYKSTKAFHSVIQENVPRPIALRVLAKDPSKHFLIVEFKDMIEQMPRVPELVAVMAKLHKESVSPEGKFGFQAPTSQSLQLENTWCDTWEEFFTRAFRETVRYEQEIQSVSEEL